MPKEYICKKPFDNFKIGDKVIPYYEDDHEIILDVKGAVFNHHIKKGGTFFADHLEG